MRGVIEQHGYFVTVFDELHCRNKWPLTLGLGGLGLMVLDTEHDEVRALLRSVVTTPAGSPSITLAVDQSFPVNHDFSFAYELPTISVTISTMRTYEMNKSK